MRTFPSPVAVNATNNVKIVKKRLLSEFFFLIFCKSLCFCIQWTQNQNANGTEKKQSKQNRNEKIITA